MSTESPENNAYWPVRPNEMRNDSSHDLAAIAIGASIAIDFDAVVIHGTGLHDFVYSSLYGAGIGILLFNLSKEIYRQVRYRNQVRHIVKDFAAELDLELGTAPEPQFLPLSYDRNRGSDGGPII